LGNMIRLYDEFEVNDFEISMIALPTQKVGAKVFRVRIQGKIEGQEMRYKMIPGSSQAERTNGSEQNPTQGRFYKDVNRR
jgi:hypothetical protein